MRKRPSTNHRTGDRVVSVLGGSKRAARTGSTSKASKTGTSRRASAGVSSWCRRAKSRVARAASVVRLLTEDYKSNPGRLTASGKGEFFPKSTNETAEGKAKNRRTEIILSPKLDELMNLLGKQ